MSRAGSAVALAVTLAVGCESAPARDVLGTRPLDAGSDAADAGGIAPAPLDASVDPALGGPCTDDGQCDDRVACTFDRCDLAVRRCRYAIDDAQCDDGNYCNGRERCVLFRGCAPGGVVSCDDSNACSLDRCVEATKGCAHAPRDADGDGDTDDRCSPKMDCDDQDPTVSSMATEVCGNGKDDDCDDQIDESDCVTPAGDTCASPVVLGGPGTYTLSTAGARRDLAPSCTVSQPSGARDVVARIEIPVGVAQDLDVSATAQAEVALAIWSACNAPSAERSCSGIPGASQVRVRARSLPPGAYFVAVTTQGESPVALRVDLREATPPAPNESCAAPLPVAFETPFVASIVDARRDLATKCAAAMGELTYSFTLPAPADVRAFASTVVGQGMPVLGLRTAACSAASDELRCRTVPAGNGLPLFARALPAGSYVLTVSATAPIDASVLLRSSPPTVAPADQNCVSPPGARVGGTMPVDLRDREDAIRDECLPGWPNAAFALDITQPSDVLLVGRFPLTGAGAVSLGRPPCARPDRLACETGGTPVRVGRRNLPPGAYRIVMGDTVGQDGSLAAFVRPTAPPIPASAADTCASAIDVPSGGGFLVGDTTAAAADFLTTCDAPGQVAGGARDQILRLVLTERRRVLLSMEGSAFITALEVRRGATCPGASMPSACYIGSGAQRSFLDLVLDADTYWIAVDGYAGDKGAWNLDVHVAPP